MTKDKQLSLFFDFEETTESSNNTEESVNPFVEETVGFKHMNEPVEMNIKADKEPKEPTTKIDVVFKKNTRGRKSIKEMEASADLIDIPDDEVLFSKLYYSMSEVTQMFQVNHSLLRFWEAEFAILNPRKNKKGDRLFRPEDIKNLQKIHHLLRIKKLTIQGAKEHFKNGKKIDQKFEAIQKLQKLKNFLLEIKLNLK